MRNLLKLNKKNIFSRNQHGFTLVELAIVILIGGVMIAMLGSGLKAYLKQSQIKTTKFRIAKVEQALEQYLRINGNYPCPASRTVTADNANYGICSGGGYTTSGQALIGHVPARSLNLSDDFMIDAWRNKLTYSVTRSLATANQYRADCGRLSVDDRNSNSLVQPQDTAHYVIVSHGATGIGAYSESATSAALTCGTVNLDRANCIDNGDFVSTTVKTDLTGSNFFDDIVVFKGQTVSTESIPTNSVVAFSTNACPVGWSDYTAADGRFILGATGGSLTLINFGTGSIDTSITGTSGTHGVNFAFNQSNDGDVYTKIPPYVALQYCVKNPPAIATCP